MKDGCPFCDYDGPSPVLHKGHVHLGYEDDGGLGDFSYFVIEPLDSVTPGHLLVISDEHVDDFRGHSVLLGAMMQAAARVAADRAADQLVANEPVGGCNLIVSAGATATQTVMHLHVHIVPREDPDGLCLPWWCASSQGAWRS